MSTVDLANGEGFIYSLEEEDNDLNDNVNNGDVGAHRHQKFRIRHF
jgi:hypothetical protein